MKLTEELRTIIAELKKPFPAPLHEIRELPGGARKWVFLRWQTVRERLDEVCPDWTIDHSEIQYLGNDATCRCGITILGVRKEAIASVPITLLSKQGNDMARGSAADRLAAEALKNAAETWGVGRYLDDQPFTIGYLWNNRHKLDEKMFGEVRKLSEQYKLFLKEKNTPPADNGLLATMNSAGFKNTRTISEAQQKRFWAIAKGELKLSDSAVKVAQKYFGFDHTEQITADKYEPLIEYLRSLAVTQEPAKEKNNDAEPRPISEEQQRKFWAIARSEIKLDDQTILAAQKYFGFKRTAEITIEKYEPLIECLRLLPTEPWHIWKAPGDALRWAQFQLPAHAPEFLQKEFEQLETTNGKKALAWVRRVQELKKLEF